MTRLIKFGPFTVTSQVFLRTAYTYGLVNLKPILPGHVLVCPLRTISRVSDLTPAEAQDFYATVQRVARVIERHYRADALNISIQDGPLAGQTVPHVHCHIIPRKLNDLANVDDVYGRLNSVDNDLQKSFEILKQANREDNRFQNPDVGRAGPRSMEEMEREAMELAKLFEHE
ncbi:hypothetical protein D0Z00_002211 [Geotrichum galactomycetum]|uniref:Uncharacterized protein n=1 Tax=Geotrichum galactomycetum TaxID=27317 RepID=A0ACB6V4V1_9ASCO|nr:hypothetical protein D0Z00_002211 [Geotrichum candidum]